MEDILNQVIAWADAHGMWSAAFLAFGMLLGPRAMPYIKGFAARTPTKVDDMAVQALEAVLACKSSDLERLTAVELEKCISTPVLAEVVRLRKAKIAEAKK